MDVVRERPAPHARRALMALMLPAALCAAQPARALDLQTAMRDAADHHPGIAAARSRADAAESMTGPAGAWMSPMLELAAVNVPSDGVIDREPMTMQMVGVSQRVPLFGRNGLERQSARAGAEAGREDARMVAYAIYGEVWRAYGAAYHAAERVHATEAHLSVMERMMASARARYESGVGRLDEVLRAEAERARALVDLADFRAEVRAATARLDALRGRTSAETSVETLDPLPAVDVPPTPAPWLAAVSGTHPGIGALEARARSERLSARAARRGVLPDVELGFSWGFREDLVTVGPDGGLAPGTARITPQKDMWSARAAFTLPIFARSDQYAEGRARDAMADAAESDRQALALQLEAAITAAHAQAIAASRTESLLADTVVVTYRRALDASWSSYTAGMADLWHTLEAAHQLYWEDIALTRARESRVEAEATFLALTGRGDLLGVNLPPAPGREP